MSFQWNAAYQLDVNCERMSIHAFLKANPKSLSGKSLDNLLSGITWPNVEVVRMRIGGKSWLFIDEISTTDPVLFVVLHIIVKQARDREGPFGLLNIILLGDFCQIPPVKGHSLAVILAKSHAARASAPATLAQKMEHQAAALFREFRRIRLKTQMRAAQTHCTATTSSASTSTAANGQSLLSFSPPFSNSLTILSDAIPGSSAQHLRFNRT